MSVAVEEVTHHEVVFAESDAELVNLAGRRLSEGLGSGGAQVVIATPDHREQLVAAVRDAGLDPRAAVGGGTLVLLDAAETLAAITPGGSFDLAAFDRVVGAPVRAAAVDRPAHAFGEMVALLWDDGRAAEAKELEQAWDDLVRETSASLLCAYPIRLVDDLDTAPEVRAVCGLHGRIVAEDALERSWRFAYDLSAASQARRAVASALRVRGVAETVFYDVQSVLTELVGNALRQSRAAVSVGLSVSAERVVVRVADEGPVRPDEDRGARVRAGSVGLRLVDELADRWGVEPATDGNAVWAELDR